MPDSELKCSRPLTPAFPKSLLTLLSSCILQSSQLASLLPSFPQSSSATPSAALPSEPSHGRQAADFREWREPGPNLHCASQAPSGTASTWKEGVLYDCRDPWWAGGHTLCSSRVLFPISPPLPSCPQQCTPPFPPEPISSSSPTSHSYTDDIQMCISSPISSCQWDVLLSA